MAIKIEMLEKCYGNKTALDHVSMVIENGMFGLLGRNGAGKTTLMQILSTLRKPSGGTVFMNDIPLEDTKQIRKIIGYLPQEFSLYPDMTVYETLRYLAALSDIPVKVQDSRIPELLKQVNLWNDRKKRVGKLSGGMKRRLGIAQALLNEPEILIVDEPTVGLDPEERLRFYNLLEEFSSNRIVLVSSHIVSDIESACETVGVLENGHLLFCDTVEKLAQIAAGKVYELTVPRSMQSDIQKDYFILSSQGHSSEMRIRVLCDTIPHIGKTALCEPTVEDGYMELLRQLDKEAER